MDVVVRELKIPTSDGVPLRKRANVLRLFGWENRPLFVPETFCKGKDHRGSPFQFTLNIFERLFVCLDDPDSCIIASVLSWIFLSVILLNIVNGIVLTIPRFRSEPVSSCPALEACRNIPELCPDKIECEPGEDPTLVIIDTACVIIFTIEAGLRIILSWTVDTAKNSRILQIVSKHWYMDECERVSRLKSEEAPRVQPDYSWWYPPVRYLGFTKNIIDILSIVPFYISLAGAGGASVSFIRVLRLARILRAFKLRGGGVMRVMIRSLKESIEPLLLLAISVAMVVLVFGSIAFTLEGGDFYYRCDWDSGLDGTTGWDSSGTHTDGAFCRGGYLRHNLPDNALEPTPFLSTLSGIYWASITMTTVGYGDLYPTSPGGRVLAVACAMCGLILMAMPISILGDNFSREYTAYRKALQEAKEDRERAEMMYQLHADSSPPEIASESSIVYSHQEGSSSTDPADDANCTALSDTSSVPVTSGGNAAMGATTDTFKVILAETSRSSGSFKTVAEAIDAIEKKVNAVISQGARVVGGVSLVQSVDDTGCVTYKAAASILIPQGVKLVEM